MSKPESQEILNMTVGTIGRDILQALVQEIKLLPNVWPKLSEAKQNDVIDRLRARVDHNVKMAVHLIASDGRTVVVGDLDQITIKDGVKAVVKFSSAAANLHELYEAGGKSVLVVVAAPDAHTAGMDEVRGEFDQRAMDLGQEYDPDGDGKGMPGDVVDVDAKMLTDAPLQSDLDAAEEDGYQAAADGKTQEQCPIMRGELCIAWVKGWKRYHELNPSTDVSDNADAASPGPSDDAERAPTEIERDRAYDAGWDAQRDGTAREVPETITNEQLRADWIEGYDDAAANDEPATGLQVSQQVRSEQVAVKYRHPGTGETWSGRGKRPKWREAALAGGAKLDDFLVDNKGDDERSAA